MKSHEWKEVACSGIIKYCIRDLFGQKQRSTLYRFFDLLSRLFCQEYSYSDATLEMDTHTVLSLMERDFPVSLNNIVFHLLHHLPFYMKKYGPVYGYWMYPFERFNCWISRQVTNRRYPESTVLATYIYYEWGSFLQLSGSVPENSIMLHNIAKDLIHNSQLDTTSHSNILGVEILSSLQHCYMNKFPRYRDLYKRYLKDQQKARQKHCIKNFPSIQDWTPSDGPQEEKCMCAGPANSGQIFKTYHCENKYKQEIIYTSQNASISNRHSSCVSIQVTPEITQFGGVKFFLSHSFLEQTNVLAYIDWYEHNGRDKVSGITIVIDKTGKSTLVFIARLKDQLVIARDETNPEKLWLLNC